jgi:hypothetical protein
MNVLARLYVPQHHQNFVGTGNAFYPLALMTQYRVRRTENHLLFQYVVVLFNCTPFFVALNHSSIYIVNVVSLGRGNVVVHILYSVMKRSTWTLQ